MAGSGSARSSCRGLCWLLLLGLLLVNVTRVLLGTPMSEVETLGPHFRSNSAILNLENQPAKCSIRQVEVPHVLKSAFINLPNSSCI